METVGVIFTVGIPGFVLKKREWLLMLDYPKKHTALGGGEMGMSG